MGSQGHEDAAWLFFVAGCVRTRVNAHFLTF